MNLEYTLIRTLRRTVSLTITHDAKLVVRAPKSFPKTKVEEVIRSKQKWILKSIAEKQQEMEILKVLNIQAGETIPFFDGELKIETTTTRSCRIVGNTLYIPVKFTNTRLVNFLKIELAKYIIPRANKFAKDFGFHFTRITITCAKTRWGFCSEKNSLSFTWRLILCPKEVVDYVILHELCHTIEKSHNKKFWNLVEKYCPDYREHKEYLKHHSRLMHIIP